MQQKYFEYEGSELQQTWANQIIFSTIESI